jgi:hypothetical protein
MFLLVLIVFNVLLMFSDHCIVAHVLRFCVFVVVWCFMLFMSGGVHGVIFVA